MFRSLGLRSEALVMAGRSTFEDKGGFIVQRTPAEPSFWYGNQLIYRAHPRDSDAMLHAFATAFPEAEHIVISFDTPGEDPPEAMLGLAGMTLDHTDILAANGGIVGPELPPGLTFRRIDSDTDWAGLVSLQCETGVEQGHDSPRHLPYLEAKFAQVRQACEQGRAAWFGVYESDLLVADMGIFWGDGLARFQSVETRKSHRGRGICAALLAKVSAFARAQLPGCILVIVAETGSPAGRIYRRAGFVLKETLVSLLKPAY
ncbi:acetyltransferase (GNAT) family protein [Candidatus Rhodobacter oscarellae]|uniref:Acetyltransferase (GNAT) family protein n=1 Tax=Candidatus Rhodobacter oscarellae TaxID=1675527 RepID=A0A0J9E7Z7_9RHOB|nr:GNAT family N-acetyltransferase [Candidatus Rhodobacter lobularis]KMW58865.1 acetyltransferase (GNAT) family protein [Candidatus Rhodobacter lobularis]